MSTICAISTPLAAGGISVIRISGDDAINIAAKVFFPYTDVVIIDMKGYSCCFGKICQDTEGIDEGVLTVFRAPKSFTGENVVEISCHGGIFVTKKVLRAIVKAGAVPAQAGEFTKRAFLNGKLSLTEAEAVMDVISAQGDQSLRAAVSTHEGALFKRINNVKNRMISLLGNLAAWVDYPEEDIEDIESGNMQQALTEINLELCSLIKSYDCGRIFRNGIDTAIVGKPNVGKSTLMNLLLGYDRSIVTNIEGTTRDIVEESVKLGEIILKLSDTAGIRDTSDVVESVGVKKANEKISFADLVLVVFDASRELDDWDLKVIDSVLDKKCIAIVNKCDLPEILDISVIQDNFKYIVKISAQDSSSIQMLQDVIDNMFEIDNFDATSGIISNERQLACVTQAQELICQANDILTIGETYDAITVLIDKACQSLLELTGEKITEAVVDNVFSRFCVGK